jgi:hypothetical protein
MENGEFLKCFLSYARRDDHLVAGVAAALQKLSVDVFTADEVLPGQAISSAILSALRAADFVCVLRSHGPHSETVAFETGVAVGLGKPVVVLTQDASLPVYADRGLHTLRLKGGDLSSVLPDLRRFVRHVKPARESEPTHATPDQFSLTAAIAELARARQVDDAVERGRALVNVVVQLFRQPNLEIIREETGADDDRPDLLLWSDSLVADFGGPLIIECKYYSAGSGSVVKNAEHTLEKLQTYVEKSSAGLGLLVFDHDRPRDLKLTGYESPRALALFVDDLIEDVRAGNLVDRLWSRRARVARLRGHSSDAG